MTRRGAYSQRPARTNGVGDRRKEKEQDDVLAPQFRAFVDERIAAQGIGSVIELADISDVGRDTLYRWFRREAVPTPRAGGRVARALGVTYRELIDAFDGRGGEAPEVRDGASGD